jgi:hypothetical protein
MLKDKNVLRLIIWLFIAALILGKLQANDPAFF